MSFCSGPSRHCLTQLTLATCSLLRLTPFVGAGQPLLFIITPGADPSEELQDLAGGSSQHREYHQLAMGQGQAEAALGLLHTCAKSGAHLHSMKFLLPVHTDPVRCSAPWLAQWSVVLLASPVLSGGISLSSTNKKCLTEVSLALLTRHQLFCACRGMAVPKKPAPDGWLAASVGEGSARPGAPSRFPPVSDH